ncbi:MAG: GMC oxidoreductase, partial [Bdellovibrionales bacterium]
PISVACAVELVKAGRRVVMIDPHRQLPPDRAALVEEFNRKPDPKTFVASMRALRRALPLHDRAKRLPYSSTHVYEGTDRFLAAETRKAILSRSLASGGLSAMWGATVMPFAARSFRNWPVTADEMAPFYRRVAEIMDVPRVHDDLEKLYPNYGTAHPSALSPQGAQLMSSLQSNRTRLHESGITFGRCRSAVGASYATNGQGCTYCGLCMYGCPGNAIFNAAFVVDRLKSGPSFDHRINWIGESFEETPQGVTVHLRHLDNGSEENIACERLYIACGASTSVRLVAGSLKWFDFTFRLMDTQLVTIPAFLRRRSGIGPVPQANALGQVFVEISDPEMCDEIIHLQVYGYNPFIADVLRARWGKWFMHEALLQPLFDRLMLVMAYLPGQLSGSVALRVSPLPRSEGGLPLAICTGETNPRTLPAVKRINHILQEHRRDFGWFPATSFTEIPEPGASHHLAGGLPMRASPGAQESDRLGRPGGLKRVHVVDGACFPALPAEHLTYTIMANAARIAAQSTEGRF